MIDQVLKIALVAVVGVLITLVFKYLFEAATQQSQKEKAMKEQKKKQKKRCGGRKAPEPKTLKEIVSEAVHNVVHPESKQHSETDYDFDFTDGEELDLNPVHVFIDADQEPTDEIRQYEDLIRAQPLLYGGKEPMLYGS